MQGADVNLCEHKHDYTALHFAGLSGNTEVCRALLLAGAKSHLTNTVGRTASQMAAFVGNHGCVATINNFVPKEEIEYYTTPKGQQTKPDLPPFIADSFHKFLMQVNIHPVRVALNLQNFVGLLEHLGEVRNVLELMCKHEMKRGSETNEVMAFKYHYLSYIVAEMAKIQQKWDATKNEDQSDEKKSDPVETFARKLLKAGKDGNLDFMDAFLRGCVMEFPFRECTIFRQMVTTLAEKDSPSALSIVTAAINGQRGFIDSIPVCSTCGEEKPAKKCSKCKVAQYCDRNCQRLHWPVHKKVCSTLSQGLTNEVQTVTDTSEISSEIQKLLVN